MPSISESILAKKPLPTALDSRAIREQWSRQLREQALFSAQMTLKGYLERLQGVLAAVADGRLDESAARLVLRAKLAELGYAAPGEGLKDAATAQRLNLILKTNRQTAGSLAQIARSQDPEYAALFPAWRLRSGGYRKNHRTDWAQRWQAAGDAVGWKGAHHLQMVALKTSPIWDALGDGVGGFRDTLGNPYPPFAFGSSYGWREVDRLEAIELGLVPDTKPVANSTTLPDGAVANGEHCQDCGEWLNGDGSCTGCQGADEAVAKGQNPDKASVQAAEVGKGKAAIQKSIETQGDVFGAFGRSDLGLIDIYWTKNGYGLKHILERRNAFAKGHPGAITGEEMAALLPEIIIHGTVKDSVRHRSRDKIVHYGNYLVILTIDLEKKKGRTHWILSGYDVNEEAAGYRRKKNE